MCKGWNGKLGRSSSSTHRLDCFAFAKVGMKRSSTDISSKRPRAGVGLCPQARVKTDYLQSVRFVMRNGLSLHVLADHRSGSRPDRSPARTEIAIRLKEASRHGRDCIGKQCKLLSASFTLWATLLVLKATKADAKFVR